jgi:hypothetical protein
MKRCVTSATMNCHVKYQVEAEGQPSVSRDGSAVSRTEVVVNTLPALWDSFSEKHAEVQTSVYQEQLLTGLVGDEEAASGGNADVCRC